MSKYRLKVKGSPGWRKYNTGLLAISVGQEKHEGEKLAATVRWTNNSFKECLIDLSDTLQRYNYMMQGASESEAYKAALGAGDDWLRRNSQFLQQFTIPVSVLRWDRWLLHPEFTTLLREFTNIYTANRIFQEAVDRDAESFTRRKDERSLVLSRRYILEEAAAFTLMAREFKAAKIYPGHQLESMRCVRDGMIPEAPYGLQEEYYTRINLERLDAAA